MPAGPTDQQRLGFVPLGILAAEGADVAAAGKQHAPRAGRLHQVHGVLGAVGNRQGPEAAGGEESRPPLIQGVTAFTVAGVGNHPLTDGNKGQRSTWTCRLAQSTSSISAAAHSLNRASPAPITAGMPSSPARIAMCEFTPPYWVMKPAMPREKIQS